MALPSSRNRTYAPGVDIASADLNALQDCIIARKHGSLSLVIDAATFHIAEQTNVNHIRPLPGPWPGGSSRPAVLGHWMALPVATRIASVAWWYNRGGAGSIVLKLLKYNITNTASGVVLTTTTINSGTGHTSTTITPAYTIEPDYTVVLWATFDNNAQSFGGAIVTIDKL